MWVLFRKDKREEYKMIAVLVRFRSYSKSKEINELKEVLDLFLKRDRSIKDRNKRGLISGEDNIAKRF